LREVLCYLLGFGILTANSVDIAWTTLGTHGGGPLTRPLSETLSKFAHALHKRWPHHRLLSFAGTAIIVALLVFWTSMLWLGWFTVFSARDDAIVDARTHRPVTVSERIFFSAYAVSTMGNGDYTPNGPGWRILVSIATLGGLGTVSMAITFMMNVLPAVVLTRTLGSYISDLGGTPTKILTRSWDGINFDSLNDHFLEMTGMIHMFTEQHLAYPVIQYFHSETERTAASLRLAGLHELVFMLCHGVAKEVRPAPMVILPLEDALNGLAGVADGEFADPAKEVPPAPPLSVLRDLNIPTVSDAEYEQALKNVEKTRRMFAGILEGDGWPWSRIWER
jgi:hypothetical protein